MAEAGADVLVPHVGLTTKGSIGAGTALTLDEAVERVQAMRDAAVAVRPGHPRPLPRRPDRRAGGRGLRAGPYEGVVGFFGASSVERLPTERAITEQVAAFKNRGGDLMNRSSARRRDHTTFEWGASSGS